MVRIASVFCLVMFLSSCSTTPMKPTPVSDLAPTGKLRAAINLGNPVLASKDPATGQPRGVSVDLSRELARRLGVPVELVTYDAAGKVVEGLKSGAWDVAYLAIDPARAFTPAVCRIEGVYLVPEGCNTATPVDRPGVGRRRHGSTRPFLSRVSGIVPHPPPRWSRTRCYGLEVAAEVKQQLEADAKRIWARARRSVHGDQPGDGNSAGPRDRRQISI
jgi:polar amino acid transport system substrate-binding protein